MQQTQDLSSWLSIQYLMSNVIVTQNHSQLSTFRLTPRDPGMSMKASLLVHRHQDFALLEGLISHTCFFCTIKLTIVVTKPSKLTFLVNKYVLTLGSSALVHGLPMANETKTSTSNCSRGCTCHQGICRRWNPLDSP